MSLEIKYGDIFKSKLNTLVNPVNCVGVQGKALALVFRQRFPKVYEEYKLDCKLGKLKIGQVKLYINPTKNILYFPTKEHWKDKSKLEWIKIGLDDFVNRYKELGITEIAFPLLGCGEGGLVYADVKPLFDRFNSIDDIKVELWVK